MRTLRPVRPPVAIEREYHKKLKALVQKMNKSLFWWLRSEYRKVTDAPMSDLRKKLKELHKYWEKVYNEEADKLAEWFASHVQAYTTSNLQRQFSRAKLATLGFDLKFTYHSRKERDIFRSIIEQNVNLIKSIASEHLTRVEGVVLRGIETGHDLSRMTDDLESAFGVSERRAAMIARDQTAKATNNLSRQRLLDYGVSKGKWMHTASGKTYRESHVDMDGTIYDIEEGCYDDDYGDYIQPGELVNCRCVCIPVLDFSKEDDFWQEWDDKANDSLKDFNENHDEDGKFAPSPVSATGANKFEKRGFANKQKLMNHWKNGRAHRDEYKELETAEEYEQKALELLESPVGGNILGHADAHGNIIRYNKETNDFAKGSPTKGIKTMFKPVDGEKHYWERREGDIEHGGEG